jgi:hypothetical protein
VNIHTELASYAIFHDFYVGNCPVVKVNGSKGGGKGGLSVSSDTALNPNPPTPPPRQYYSLATAQEEAGEAYQPRLASAATITPPVSPTNKGGGAITPPIVSGATGAAGGAAGPAAMATVAGKKDADGDGETTTTHRLFGLLGGMVLNKADIEAIEDVNHL